ncbi:hypothetical protein CHLRE_16g684000v5 [Chlamydomonas reinhardtii]|uniref:WLM domain-containing protein n=1 Tax=Chlamydomonas reinhardtii TaxID=3055 RepID=A0A2K3CUU9_CHLRE|nr:uncharacterized protein CHLRE_16g684000v5 [Chlamydomonas reinhardtii]PNW72062.1 hypothetical protein CHLRE_16g684000v5 [Chlamydomonas reinhardtii]
MSADEFTVHLHWRGGAHTVTIAHADPTLEELGRAICAQCGAALETVKLLVSGRKGYIAPAQAPGTKASEAGLVPGCRPLLIASRAEDVDQVRRAPRDATLTRGFDEELKRAARRRRTATAAQAQPPRAEYTFGRYEAWQVPGLQPPPSEALKLLYRLANDPGILGIMAAHRYKVGLLREMPPEGKVGISPVCVLGLNTNAGQSIDLRLRTDDLKGFRKYERIRETLIHELAHNEFSEHGADFKELNSRLGRECAAINARYSSGHAVLDAAAAAGGHGGADGDTRASELDAVWLADEDGVMAATARMSGRTLRQLAAAGGAAGKGAAGGAVAGAAAAGRGLAGTGAARVLPPRLVAAAAALQRSQEQQQRARQEVAAAAAAAVASGSALPAPLGLAADAAPGTPQLANTTGISGTNGGDTLMQEAEAMQQGEGSGSDSGSVTGSADGADEDVRRFEHFDADTAAAEAAMRRLEGGGGGGAGEAEAEGEGEVVKGDVGGVAGGGAVDMVQEEAVAAVPPAADAAGGVPAAGGDSARGAHASRDDGVDGSLADLMDVDVSGAHAAALAAPPAATAPAPAPAVAAATDATLGGPAAAAAAPPAVAHAPAALPQPPPALVRLALTPPPELAPAAAAAAGDGGSADGAASSSSEDVVQQKLRQAWAAVTQLAAAPAATPSDVVAALDTLETMLGNAAHFPGEDKYRRVRLGNGAFQKRVGRLPGGTALLRVAGFVEEVEGASVGGGGAGGAGVGGAAGGEAVLRLRRNDPGLLWLVVSVVREARGQAEAQLAAAAAAGCAGAGAGGARAQAE